MYTETPPSNASNEITLSNGSLKVNWTNPRQYQSYSRSVAGYNSVCLWRTKAGGSEYWLDTCIAGIGSTATGYIDSSKEDSSLGNTYNTYHNILSDDGFNSKSYYRSGDFCYFGGYGVGDDIEVAFNEIVRIIGRGMMFYGHLSTDLYGTVLVHDNIVARTGRQSIVFGGGDGGHYTIMTNGYVYNNILYDCNRESGDGLIEISRSIDDPAYPFNVYVYNNTFYQYNNVDEPAIIVKCNPNLDFKNNIVYNTNSTSSGMISYTNLWSCASSCSDCSGDHNLWYGNGVGTKPTWDNSTLGDVNPMFIQSTPSNTYSDFTLQSGSPSIGSGTQLNSIFTTDFNELTRGDVWDIGAIEYVPTYSSSPTLRGGIIGRMQ